MTKTGTPREGIVKKLNNIHDEPTFFLNETETKWIVKDWIESHTKKKVAQSDLVVEGADYNAVAYMEVTVAEEPIMQGT